jgi:hypothetical protein
MDENKKPLGGGVVEALLHLERAGAPAREALYLMAETIDELQMELDRLREELGR